MATRPSFSNDSRIITRSFPKSLTLKDHLLDDLSSCSSNGFRSYPRRHCCTKVRYLIEIDLNKHNKLPPTQNQLLKTRSKPKPKLKLKSSSVFYKASVAVVNVFKNFNFSGSGSGSGTGKPRKGKLLRRNLSRKLSNHGFWKRTLDRNYSCSEPIKQNENIKLSAAVTTTAEVKLCTSNSNSSASVDSYFTINSGSSTSGGSSKINVAQNVVKETDEFGIQKMNPMNGENAAGAESTGGNADGNTKEKLLSDEKDHFSPISVMDFPCDNDNDNEDEVTSPFHNSYLYITGSKGKVMPKVQRTNTLKPVRLEDRIALSESTTHDLILETSLQSQSEIEENQTKKKAIALLQLFKATMPSHDLSESTMTESVLLEFFTERVIEGNVSNYTMLQDAKDWICGLKREMFDSDDYKLAYIRDMEKGVKWLTYDEIEKGEVVSVLEYDVFTSLVEEMLLDLEL